MSDAYEDWLDEVYRTISGLRVLGERNAALLQRAERAEAELADLRGVMAANHRLLDDVARMRAVVEAAEWIYPFIARHLAGAGIDDLGRKLKALRELGSTSALDK